MRILQIHTQYRQPGGEDAVVAQEGKLLQEAGHIVERLRFDNPPSAVQSAGPLLAAPWNPHAARRVRRIIAATKPDVAHVHNTWFASSPSVVEAVASRGVPVVLTLHNYRLLCANAQLFRDGAPCEACVGTHPWRGVMHRCYRSSVAASIPAAVTIAVNRYRGTWARSVTRFIALTEFARNLFVAGGLPEERISVKPNAVADPGPRLCAPSDSRTVLAVGRLSPEKGFDLLVRAAHALSAAGLELVVVGDGPDRQRLEGLARGFPVRFLGWLPNSEVRMLLRSSRALCFPSRWYETFGLVAVEAMAAGLPVLASDLGGIPEVVGDAGQVLSVRDESAWSEAFARLCEDVDLDAQGHRGRVRWEQRYSPEVCLPVLESIYDEVREWAA